jgi:hydrogenase expression/formation protein HypE
MKVLVRPTTFMRAAEVGQVIKLAHGSGGEASKKLITEIVETYLANDIIKNLDDSAVIPVDAGRLAFTTDSYVVDPVFFPGGDIGSLAVNGTVNDLSMVGAQPLAITLGLILEEGFPLADLHRILRSVKEASAEAGVVVAGGDTKVVERGSADGIFVNTSGIGVIAEGVDISSANARLGDVIIVSGPVGDHGIAVLSQREGIDFKTDLKSDTAPLNGLVAAMLSASKAIHAMRDPTRGGLATSLNEIAEKSGVGVLINEASVPIRPEVTQACELLGFDPLYIANEGRLVAFVPAQAARRVLEAMRGNPYGAGASVIGETVASSPGMVLLNTAVGGQRILSPLSGELLPRIC